MIKLIQLLNSSTYEDYFVRGIIQCAKRQHSLFYRLWLSFEQNITLKSVLTWAKSIIMQEITIVWPLPQLTPRFPLEHNKIVWRFFGTCKVVRNVGINTMVCLLFTKQCLVSLVRVGICLFRFKTKKIIFLFSANLN